MKIQWHNLEIIYKMIEPARNFHGIVVPSWKFIFEPFRYVSLNFIMIIKINYI